MSETIKALSRQWFEQVWNQRDDSAILRLASPRIVTHGLTQDLQPAHGIDQFIRFRKSFLAAFPDLKIFIQDILVDGDKSVVRLAFSGTHTGQGIGIAPTGRPVSSTAIIVIRWLDGKAIEAWNEFDAAGMMRQLHSHEANLRT